MTISKIIYIIKLRTLIMGVFMDTSREARIGLLLGPHYVRLAASAGFAFGFLESSLKEEVPIPKHIYGVSSGGVVTGSFAPWTMKAGYEAISRIRKLRSYGIRGSDFHEFNKDLEFWGLLETVAALAPLIPFEVIEKNWLRYLAKGTASLSVLGLEAEFIQKFFGCDAVFSNDRLFDLLMKYVDYEATINSKVKVEIIVADINGDPATNKRVRLSSVTNYRPEDIGNKEKFVRGIVTGASPTGFFPTHRNELGHSDTDGIIYTAFPIGLARKDRCNVIIVAKFNYAGQGYMDHDYSKWMSALHRSMDIKTDDETDRIIRGYMRVNNDVERISKMRQSLTDLRTIINDVDPEVRTILGGKIVEIEDELSRLYADGKEMVNLVIIDSEKIPEFSFRHFDEESNRVGENIGYDAFYKNKDLINRAVEVAMKGR